VINVTDIELSRKLKEARFPQDTFFWWFQRGDAATQHNPTMSLVDLSFHCHETGRFVSSVLATFVAVTH
jgi:hypothetical protein